MSALTDFELSAQELHRHFSSGRTATLRRRSDPAAEPLVDVPVAFGALSIEQAALAGVESGTQTVSFAALDLVYKTGPLSGQRFRLDALSTIELGGQQFPWIDLGGPSGKLITADISTSRSTFIGLLPVGG